MVLAHGGGATHRRLLERLNRMNSSLEHKKHLEHLHTDYELKAKRLAGLNLYNVSPENKEHIKRLA